MLRSETTASAERRARALAGLAAYQQAPRGAPWPRPAALHRAGRARLLDYGGNGRPIVVVPSLINPPFVLDLASDHSLLRWLATQGMRPLLIDWGTPPPEACDVDINGHIEQMLLPLVDAIGEQPAMVGYCLGGTMAMAAAHLRSLAGLALIAAPWHFSGFGPLSRGDIARLWALAEPACRALGLVPMEILQSGFWQLDPARTIAKYEAFAVMAPDASAAQAFVALEDWANGGAPLTYAAGAQLFDFIANDIPGSGSWSVAGQQIGPATLDCPAVDFVSTSDRIVPQASAAHLRDTRCLNAGHVGMVIGSRARAQLWEPLAAWLGSLK